MKNLCYLFLFATQILFAQGGFDKGNELYKKGDFAGAADAYESVLKTGKQSGELYFNLANSYYKLNQTAPAIYNYEKALLIDPGNKDYQNNLMFAQKMQIDDIKEVPKVGFSKIIRDFTSGFHYDTWAWISVGTAVLFLILFLAYYFTAVGLYKRIFFGAMFFALLLLVLSVGSAIFERSIYLNERPAIVFQTSGVKSEPSVDAPDAFILHEGTKAYVIETLDDWKKIELADENSGWIQKDKIKELK